MGLLLPPNPPQRPISRTLRPQARTRRIHPASKAPVPRTGHPARRRTRRRHRRRNAQLHGIPRCHRPRHRAQQTPRIAAQAPKGNLGAIRCEQHPSLCYNLPTAGAQPPMPSHLVEVSELADEHDLGSCAERRGSSSLPFPTRFGDGHFSCLGCEFRSATCPYCSLQGNWVDVSPVG